MFNSNQVTIEVDGVEYTLSLNRKGAEAIEKYTKASKKRELAEKYANVKETEDKYIDEIPLDENPFGDETEEESFEEQTDELLEMLKRLLWICLWDNHHMNIEQTRELLVKIIEKDKLNELTSKINELIEGVNKQLPSSQSDYLKNMKALKAQK